MLSSNVDVISTSMPPADIVERLNREINQVLGAPDIRERFASLGRDPQPGTVPQFADYVRAEVAKWAAVVKTTGIAQVQQERSRLARPRR